ncbi:MAG: hypothetical protein GTN74_00595 [Proteobacteria bacterium]|nr:hypothetical protein [Pseudomonadota bacterium]NIS67512.1 hypothetical protein [Pseudomonadota bacterium]
MIGRRSHPRVKASHAVLYLSEIYSGPRVASTLDFSSGTVRVETPYSLTNGEKVELSIAIHPQVIECKGHVVETLWPDEDRLKVRVQFQEIRTQDRLYLQEQISRLMEKQRKWIHGSA